jgi:hypothetical protein
VSIARARHTAPRDCYLTTPRLPAVVAFSATFVTTSTICGNSLILLRDNSILFERFAYACPEPV